MGGLKKAFIKTLLHAHGHDLALNDLGHRVGEWIASGDTGQSSEALCAAMLGASPQPHSAPSDAHDFGRCYRLLNRIPEWRPRIGEMAVVSTDWRRLVESWHEIEAAYESDYARSGRTKGWSDAAYAVMNRVRERAA